MPDAISVLTNDHRTVNDLFARVEGNPEPMPEVVHRIVTELSVHDVIEKEHLYPAIRKYVDGGDDLADRSVTEHDQVARTLLAIDKAGDGSSQQVDHLAALITLVRRHVTEEESELFVALRSSMTADQLEQLGQSLVAAKQTAPTRPHPLAPSEGLATKVAGAVSAPLDRMKDKLQGR